MNLGEISEWELSAYIGALVACLLVSAFFSSSETSTNSINRYRLSHRARSGQKWAQRVVEMLKRPDQLLGVILVGNNVANVAAAMLVTLLATRIWGEVAIAPAGFVLTVIILIFAEIVPKNIAAYRPENVASWVINPLRVAAVLLSPLVWLVNSLAQILLKPFKLKTNDAGLALNESELKVILETASTILPAADIETMLRVLGMRNLTVADAMVPYTEIFGIDLEDPIEEILSKLHASSHSALPVYRRSIDESIGFLNLRSLSKYLGSGEEISKTVLENSLSELFFVPEMTALHRQFQYFRDERINMALVVDEYGSVQGLLTMSDMIAEIVGEFDAAIASSDRKWQLDIDGSILLDGSELVREVNRELGWVLSDSVDARTINGLILEELEVIPEGHVSMSLGDCRLETQRIEGQAIRQVRIWQHRS
ncbi:MAG: HlyC/CorC family transporter [Gammaproteobacteria bacterium]